MSLLDFLRIIYRNGIWMALCAFSLGGLTWASLKNQAPQYSSHSVINTGLVSAYTIESNEGGTIDYAFTNNELQNIINVATSYHTMEELGLRLLAHALLKGDSAQILLPENRKELEENLGAKVVKKLRVSSLRVDRTSYLHPTGKCTQRLHGCSLVALAQHNDVAAA